MSTELQAPTTFEHVDVLVVGAGITGISMGYHLSTLQPDKTFAIVEAREAIGGTWDLFRYPGIRSDADLQTFGFGFKPWTRDNAIADGDEILEYLHETIDEYGLGRHLHLGHKVIQADFSSAESRWAVTLERTADGSRFDVSCSMLFSAAGYYDTDEGYTPNFEGRDEFGGIVVHPQHWPQDLDYSDKRVVVIGSGATAVTIIPALAGDAAHVTMLQRSPSYVMTAPRQDPIANTLRRALPDKVAYAVTRFININKQELIYRLSRRFPQLMRALIRKSNARVLPEGYDVDTHFKPDYAPWDQRMCLVPDADLFKAISDGDASVVTDKIVRFTPTGILLESGDELEADIIVTATGLNMVPFGKMSLRVDGDLIDPHDHVTYKTLMVSGIPNFGFTVGYVHAAWTLKADLVAQWFCRLLAHMDRHGYVTVTPVVNNPSMTRSPMVGLSSGYINRAMQLFPQQGSQGPWQVAQDYKLDRTVLGKDPIGDPALVFTDSRVMAGANA